MDRATHWLRQKIWLAAVMFLALPVSALAEAPPDITPAQPANTPGSIEILVKNLFNIGVAAGGMIFLIMFFVGAIGYLAGSGDEKATGEAKKRMVDAIVGLVLTLGAWTVAKFIGSSLNAPGF